MNQPHTPTLGTLLRHLIEHLDGAVEEAYTRTGLDYRPRFTPIVRALQQLDEAPIKAIAEFSGMTHSAVSQTVAQMKRQKLVKLHPGADARERLVSLTPAARALLPSLERQWAATNAAARQLDEELSGPLSNLLLETIRALELRSFTTRLQQAEAALENHRGKSR